MGVLDSFRKRYFEPHFELEYHTPTHVFRNDSPNVQGTVTLKVLKPLKNVSCIQVGFHGQIHNYYRHVYLTYGLSMSGAITKVKEHTEDRVLFDEKENLDYDTPVDMLPTDEPIERHFGFSFPSHELLPSSVHKLGGDGDNQGYTSVSYYLYVKVIYKGDIFHTGEIVYTFPVLYQGYSDAYAQDALKSIRTEQTFKAKLKRQIFDSESGGMIPNPIDKPRKLTRGIRQLWNQNYKSDAYVNLAQDVSLLCDFIFNENFNLSMPLDKLLRLRFATPANGNDEFQGKLPTIGSEYVVDGRSTGLGEFVIKELDVQLLHQLAIRTDYFLYRTRILKDLYSVKPKDSGFKIDFKDFQYDSRSNSWYLDVHLSDLMGKTSTIPLIDELVRPVMCSYDLESFLHIVTALRFKLKVGNGEIDQGKTLTFETDVFAVVNYFAPLPAYGEEGSPPPAYPPGTKPL
ncbi:DEKNAAC100340 [Brettanomyces naardenensis]|uniref:DEKNAAC100340 n=1 Tax=Brettanomyces naardenensis TaxID=13370 RepID=A0A448YFK5_BRENA|nr:DEKNAAC100340 [Brettanomyces naardenensis]